MTCSVNKGVQIIEVWIIEVGLYRVLEIPRCTMNLRIVAIQAEVVKSDTSSRCTALVAGIQMPLCTLSCTAASMLDRI